MWCRPLRLPGLSAPAPLVLGLGWLLLLLSVYGPGEAMLALGVCLVRASFFFSRRIFWLAVLGSSPWAGSALLVPWTLGGGVAGPGLGRLGLVCPARESGGCSRLLSLKLLPRVMPWLRRYII